MRHVFLTLDFPPDTGGVARYYSRLLEEWPEHVLVIAPQREGLPHIEQKGRVTIERHQMLSSRYWPKWLALFPVMRRIRRRYPRAVIHVGQALPIGIAALFFRVVFKMPYLVYAHGLDMYLGLQTFRKRLMTGLVVRRALLVVANSQYTASLVSRYSVLPNKIIVATPGRTPFLQNDGPVAPQSVRQAFAISGSPVILSVARLVHRKGIDIVIKSIAQLAEEYPGIQYVVAGDGPELEALEQLVTELHLERHVRFAKNITDGQLAALYALCDLFVLTPREIQESGDVEGFGIVYLEANSFGKAVIGSRTGGVAEAVAELESGMLVAPEQVEELAQTVRMLLSDAALRESLGNAGRERVLRDFAWRDRASAIHTAIQQQLTQQ